MKLVKTIGGKDPLSIGRALGPQRLKIPILHYEDLRKEKLPAMKALGTTMLGDEVLVFELNKYDEATSVEEILVNTASDNPGSYSSIAVFFSDLNMVGGNFPVVAFSAAFEGPRARQAINEIASRLIVEANDGLRSRGGLLLPEVAIGEVMLPIE